MTPVSLASLNSWFSLLLYNSFLYVSCANTWSEGSQWILNYDIKFIDINHALVQITDISCARTPPLLFPARVSPPLPQSYASAGIRSLSPRIPTLLSLLCIIQALVACSSAPQGSGIEGEGGSRHSHSTLPALLLSVSLISNLSSSPLPVLPLARLHLSQLPLSLINAILSVSPTRDSSSQSLPYTETEWELRRCLRIQYFLSRAL